MINTTLSLFQQFHRLLLQIKLLRHLIIASVTVNTPSRKILEGKRERLLPSRKMRERRLRLIKIVEIVWLCNIVIKVMRERLFRSIKIGLEEKRERV